VTDLRLSYYVAALDPDSDFYDSSDSSIPEEEGIAGRIIDPVNGNAWSYRAADGSDMHYPCFDVDLVIMGDDQESLLNTLFPNHRRVMSSTPNHFHVYSDDLMTWDDYWEALMQLKIAGVIEDGYINTSSQRGATFVRKPHIKKKVQP
jgi:hypothetical protein